MGGSWGGQTDDADSIRSIHKALDLGVNFFDTADVYGFGRSERVLGKALEGRRSQAVIATKFAWRWDEAQQKMTEPTADPEYVRSACEASLRRLRTDWIDLYQFHWNDFGPEGAEAVIEVLEELVAAGKIRSYGWSTDYEERARAFAAGPNCTAIQSEINVINDNPGVLQICEEFDLASINRGPLAMGLLTGKYQAGHTMPQDDIRGPHAPGWMKYFKDAQPNPEWLDQANKVSEVLRSGGRTLAQGAIAWLWARSEKCVPIPGFRSVAQVEENCGALEFGPLTAEQMKEIDEILGRGAEVA